MKNRLLVMVVALVLALCMTIPALADEILFRSIPWFGDYNTVTSALQDAPIVWKAPESELGKYVLDEVEERSSNYDRNYQCTYTVTSNKKQSSLKVAGYDVATVKLYFAYTANANGEIDRKVENTSFYLARYTIEPADYEVASGDLLEKLTGIYGTPKKVENSNECASGNATYYRWEADNDSFVVLTREDTSFSGEPDIYIYYGNNKGTDLIKACEAILKKAEANSLKDAGSDGL